MLIRRIISKPREDDERILRWLRQRAAGLTLAEITRYEGAAQGAKVAEVTIAVRDHDLSESTTLRPGEDPASVETEEDVLRGYRWRKRWGAKL